MFPKVSKATLKVIIAACFGSISYGYVSGVGGTIIAQPTFIDYFNYDSSASIADTFNGLLSGGGLIGVFIGGTLSESYGRRFAIWCGSLIGVIGATLMTASVDIPMLYVSRIILGMSIGMLVMLIPLYQTEVAPTEGRGLLVCMHGVLILIGYCMAFWINVGVYFLKTEGSWRIPAGIQILWPIALAISLFFLPESPRWLIEHGEIEKARKIMMELEPEMTNEEFDLLHHQISIENQKSSWLSILTTKSYRRRLYVGLSVMIGGQATGTLVVTNYGPTLYAALGFNNLNQLLISSGYITCGVLSNLASAFLSDVAGRKTLMIVGIFGSGIIAMSFETIMVALYGGSDNKSGNAAAVFFMFFHILIYGGCVDANTYVYVNEIWPTHIRSKGAALCTSGLFIGILAFTTGVTTAINTIHWKFFIVFICLSTVFLVIAWFFFPETKNVSLEEVGRLFGDYPLEDDNQVNAIDGKSLEKSLKETHNILVKEEKSIEQSV
ncbi:hypothetical protein DASC09_005580 [Saccharomycopsis crataegensis]|uniref:Major facilitator superfamily (MFS) profile domain-containing protein n=1 Tax=Saccharomycopsis crataegensis TaxID=43959 RepID=A0AAV5QEQ6_9ASCO|nr:hypothetical protein DASC09_005580 [Saccharomycopsis crataegensis]